MSENPFSSADKPVTNQFERPLECTECKRSVAVYYSEIVNNIMANACMCAECPVLKRRLQGAPHMEEFGGNQQEAGTLACGNCGTTLDAIRVGTALGCDACYKVFDDVLLSEMLSANKVPQRIAKTTKTAPVHIGRSTREMQEISPSLRLLALNEALNEMIKTEDYEQAAWLRDQIKALTEKPSKKEEREANGKK